MVNDLFCYVLISLLKCQVSLCYGSTGPSGYRDSETSQMAGSRVLGRVGLSVNSGASMSVIEVRGS